MRPRVLLLEMGNVAFGIRVAIQTMLRIIHLKALLLKDFYILMSSRSIVRSSKPRSKSWKALKVSVLPGWHIPTLSDFMALVGKCNNTEIEPQTDAPYYDAVRNRGSLSMLKEAGFVGKESGYIQGLGVGYEHGYKTLGYFVSMGYVTVSYIFCSTHYRSLSGHPIACGVRCIKNN